MAKIISTAYETALGSLTRSSSGYIYNLNKGITITADNDLVGFKINSVFQKETSLYGNTVSKYAEITLISDVLDFSDWLDNQVDIFIGIEVSPQTYEYISQGRFRVRDIAVAPDKYETKLTAYDGMVRLNAKYPQPDASDFPMTLRSLATVVAAEVGLELDAATFPNENFLVQIPNVGNNEYTYRNIISWIAELSATNAIMTSENKLKFVSYAATTTWNIASDDYYSFTADPLFGPLTAVQITRDALGDIISYPEPITEDDIVYNIIDNMVGYDQREDIIQDIYNVAAGFQYIPYSLKWDGTYHLEQGDRLLITDNNNNTYICYYANSIITYNGAVSEELYMRAYTPETAAIKTKGEITKKANFTSARVDKVENQITLVASDVEDLGSKYSQILVDIDGISSTVQKTDDELGTLKSQVVQTATDLTFLFGQNEEMRTYYNFDETSLTIGRKDQGVIEIGFPDNTPEVIIKSGSDTAKIKSDQMTISNIVVGNSLDTGKHTVKTLTIGGIVYTVFLPQG